MMIRILKLKTHKKGSKTQSTNYLKIFKSQHRRLNNTQNRDSMSLSQVTNPITLAPNANDLEDLSDKEFRRMTMSMFKQIKDTNIL